ncbi:MAG: phosphatidate cytidylyltransferase, partial [Planctomycetota bacterium]
FDVPYGLMGWLMLGTMAGLFVSLLGELRRFTTEDHPPGEAAMKSSIVSIGLGSLSVLYVGVLMSFLVRLRLFDDPSNAEEGAMGLVALGSLIFTVKLSDTGQYAVGRLFGRTKLAPRLSPGKTWEGTLGGIAISTVVSALLLCWVVPEFNPDRQPSLIGTGVYCFFLNVIGVVGDLTESLLKRDSGVKDSSDWLPGMGGVLDVLDSLLMTAPLAVLWW